MLPPTPESLLFQGQALLAAGQSQDAQRVFRQAARICKHAPSLLEIAYAMQSAGDQYGALATFRWAYSHDQRLTEAAQRVGSLLIETGGAQSAISFLQAAIKKNPDDAVLLLRLAEAFDHQDRHQEAYDTLKKAEALAPENDSIRQLLEKLKPKAAPKKSFAQLLPVASKEASTVEFDFKDAPTQQISFDSIPVEERKMTSSATITSDLQEFRLPELLQLLVSRKATGKMEVYSQSKEGVLGLLEGRIVNAWRSDAQDLVDILASQDRISLKDQASLKEFSSEHDAEIGTRLFGREILTEEEVVTLLKERITTTLKTIMSWTEGYSTFIRSEDDKLGETMGVSIDTQWAVFEAFRLLDEENAE